MPVESAPKKACPICKRLGRLYVVRRGPALCYNCLCDYVIDESHKNKDSQHAKK